jgi:hypothetical protein
MRRVILGVVVLLALVAWWLHDPERSIVGPKDREPDVDRSATLRDPSVKRDAFAKLRTGIPKHDRRDGTVTISGTVIDRDSSAPVGNVEVVFRNPGGEESVMAGADGTYRIDVEPGAYRAFVRDDSVLSFGPAKWVRIPTMPEADDIGLPDETSMPLVVASRDLEHVDLRVLRGGTVRGRVLDRDGRPIARAVVRAIGVVRPVLGTDLVETDANGAYELVLPAGWWKFDAGHPSYAGVDGTLNVRLEPGETTNDHDLTLVAGCVISGRVVGPDGKPTGEGAIEQGPDPFVISGRIAANGTFRWTTMVTGEVTLRAWPWKSPSSAGRSFACREGARFQDVVFQLPGRGPDIEGTLADVFGEPVALAFIDLRPLDTGGIAQQERTDADGKFAVYQMPAGRYRVSAYAPGRGVLSTIVTAPQTNVRLALGGTGRISGTVKGITNGSFELRLSGCDVDGSSVFITEDTRIAGVRDGTFELEGIPACKLVVTTTMRDGERVRALVDVPANGVGKLDLVLVDDPIEDEPRLQPPAPRPHSDEPPDEPFEEAPVLEGST